MAAPSEECDLLMGGDLDDDEVTNSERDRSSKTTLYSHANQTLPANLYMTTSRRSIIRKMTSRLGLFSGSSSIDCSNSSRTTEKAVQAGTPKMARSMRRLAILSICVILLLITVFRLFASYRERKTHFQHEDIDMKQLEKHISEKWIVSSPKCHIPAIDPWHHSIRSFVWRQNEIDCKAISQLNKTDLTYVHENQLYFTQEAIQSGILNNSECCYRSVQRAIDSDDVVMVNGTCDPIHENGLFAPAGVIKVVCKARNYENFHSFIKHNIEEDTALARVAEAKLLQDQYYNVVILGLDTISRLNGQRQLSLTLKTLHNLTRNVVDFRGYTKVGENTFPNLVPLLTGLTPEQLVETHCWNSDYNKESESGNDYLDNCKYLWNYYQDLGYTTYFQEDWPKASTFNYLKSGFKFQPTNIYGRPYTLIRDEHLLPPVGMGCTKCLGDKPIVSLDLQRLKTFLQEYKSVPHFAFHWINCPQHDDLNGASTVDRIVSDFIKDIHPLVADRTFFVLLSDHGYRWESFISTRIGHYEASLPMLNVIAPDSFVQRHPDLYRNLKDHSSVLITPFDVFKTFTAIRDLGASGGIYVRPSTAPRQKSSTHKRVVSTNSSTSPAPVIDPVDESTPTAFTTVEQLVPVYGLNFKQHFSTLSLLDKHNSSELDRSCIEAGVPDNFCVCNRFRPISSRSLDALGAAYYLVYIHLNAKIREHPKLCHPLDLEKIHKCEMHQFPERNAKLGGKTKREDDYDDYDYDERNFKYELIKESPSESTTRVPEGSKIASDDTQLLPEREYNMRFSTKPGGAVFQEVVRYNGENISDCRAAVRDVKKFLEEGNPSEELKHAKVSDMNRRCRFSVHSGSFSRLNLYKDQSGCVKSDIELKKICYCEDLLVKT